MKSRTLICITATTLLALLALPTQLPAQAQGKEHLRYKLIDLGTFGGPSSYLATTNEVTSPGAINQALNNQGIVVGWRDTSTLQQPVGPLGCFNFDCFLPLAFQWQKGVLTDLGVLPGGDASVAFWISDNGLIAEQATNGVVDPLLPDFLETRAVLWQDGKAIDLGTLGGNESGALSVNDRGQVVGFATNTIPDPLSILAAQIRAFLWQDGAMRDLGTLGTGNDSLAEFVNERGQVAGWAFTNATTNPATGSPTTDPFLWEHGTIQDLGTLGGTIGFPYGLNNRGQVIGTSDLSGDLATHPFLWTKPGPMQDLGTFGGSFGFALGINDAGEVVGFASDQNEAPLAFLWKDGVMTNLGTLSGDDCSFAFHINSKGQIVGISFPCAGGPAHGFLWQHGFMTDLNALLPPGSSLTPWGDGAVINDRGEIAGVMVLPSGDFHAFLLVPCGEGTDQGTEGCVDAVEGAAATTNLPARSDSMPTIPVAGWRARLAQRYHIPGLGAHGLAPDSQKSIAALASAPHNLVANPLNTYQIRISWLESSAQTLSGFHIYRCHGCASPRTEGTKIASVGASSLSYTDGSATSPLTETTTYTYQLTAFNGSGESAPSNTSATTTKTEPAPTGLSSFAFTRGEIDDIVELHWTNNATDDDSYFLESCSGPTCTNFSVIAKLPANTTSDNQFFQFFPDIMIRYRIRAHSPGGFSAYSNIRNQLLP